MPEENEAYQKEREYEELLKTGIGKSPPPITGGPMTAEEIADYTEELMYSVDLYGADKIRRPSATGKILSVAGKTKGLIDTAISSNAAKSFGQKMRDWNDRLEEKERREGKNRQPFFPR